MVMQGETVATGAQSKCLDCGAQLEPQVCHSAAGYYVGYWCDQDGPHSRESGYYRTSEDAERALASGEYSR